MAGRLAAVPEESMDCSTAAYPPRSAYRDWIRTVAVSGMQIRSTLFSHSQSGHSGSSYSSGSGPSNSNPSNNSGCSSGSALSAAGAEDFGADELKMIARQMVSDGYTQRLVQAFEHDDDADRRGLEIQFLEIASPKPALDPALELESWFLELDVAWVLQIRQEHGSQWQLPLQDNSGSSSLQDLVKRWIRGLTVIVHSILELSSRHEMTAVKRFGEASILKMLVFVDAVVPAFKAENLRALLDMYIHVRRAFDYMIIHYLEGDLTKVMLASLYKSVVMLTNTIVSTMEKVVTLIEGDSSWAVEVQQGGGEVHRNTRWITDCIVSLSEAQVGSTFHGFPSISLGEAQVDSTFSSIYNSRSIAEVIDGTIDYLKDLLLRKSELCSDLSLGHLFLLNNSYFAAQMIKPYDTKLTVECKKYVGSYLDVSWGHVLSCIPKSNSPGPLLCWINTTSLSSLDKFESTFNKTYQAQKFWKVPEPELRNVLRRAITERVVPSYCDYLKEHPELAEHVSRRNSTPEVLEEMLGQLFEG
jgi:hypothetical protein